jgi:hypothetical protein
MECSSNKLADKVLPTSICVRLSVKYFNITCSRKAFNGLLLFYVQPHAAKKIGKFSVVWGRNWEGSFQSAEHATYRDKYECERQYNLDA